MRAATGMACSALFDPSNGTRIRLNISLLLHIFLIGLTRKGSVRLPSEAEGHVLQERFSWPPSRYDLIHFSISRIEQDPHRAITFGRVEITEDSR
jgi:hypothetical protein